MVLFRVLAGVRAEALLSDKKNAKITKTNLTMLPASKSACKDTTVPILFYLR